MDKTSNKDLTSNSKYLRVSALKDQSGLTNWLYSLGLKFL